jgi:hypothetical protein
LFTLKLDLWTAFGYTGFWVYGLFGRWAFGYRGFWVYGLFGTQGTLVNDGSNWSMGQIIVIFLMQLQKQHQHQQQQQQQQQKQQQQQQH